MQRAVAPIGRFQRGSIWYQSLNLDHMWLKRLRERDVRQRGWGGGKFTVGSAPLTVGCGETRPGCRPEPQRPVQHVLLPQIPSFIVTVLHNNASPPHHLPTPTCLQILCNVCSCGDNNASPCLSSLCDSNVSTHIYPDEWTMNSRWIINTVKQEALRLQCGLSLYCDIIALLTHGTSRWSVGVHLRPGP